MIDLVKSMLATLSRAKSIWRPAHLGYFYCLSGSLIGVLVLPVVLSLSEVNAHAIVAIQRNNVTALPHNGFGCAAPESTGNDIVRYEAALLRLRGIHAWNHQDSQVFLDCLAAALRLNPDDQMIQFWLGRAYFTGGNTMAAVQFFAEARAGIHIYRNMRLLALARMVLREETTRNPTCYECWLTYGDALTGEYRESASYIDWFNSGLEPEWQEAIDAYENAVRLQPQTPEALSALAFAQYYSGQDEEGARNSLEYAISLEMRQPIRALWAMRLGIWHRNAGNVLDSTKWLLWAKELLPYNCSIRLELAVAFAAAQNNAEAIQQLGTAATLCPGNEAIVNLFHELQQ